MIEALRSGKIPREAGNETLADDSELECYLEEGGKVKKND